MTGRVRDVTITITIDLPLPDRELCGNGRAHGHSRSQLVAMQRAEAALCAYRALAALPGTLTGPLFAAGVRVRVAVAVRRSIERRG